MENQNLELPREIEILKQIPVWVFGISFIIGTILFILYFIDNKPPYEVGGYGIIYTIVAYLVNGIVFIGLAIASFIYKEYQTNILARATLLLLNILISIIYFLIIASCEKTIY
ncbi:MAG: hypothetical protein BM557_05650 [Flavobacterium sp. MedPE-SWcel]|uniref:hypothetical protein n=1 Tax=uncultured Flavobacterium sp. TaxID=165435 RepID=UPI0009102140|nr:hypothetical protein [uncultured Flavobacterium sp.]OIQ20153.1 MAG: hypothetical protein BM557_05650 [Flavobacterium sp. MedPE-SWcel]